MSEITGLSPKGVFYYFNEICKIPRPSKHEELMISWLLKFGESLGLKSQRDEIGNVLITKPATPGKEHITPVIFQSHIDMVCEKNEDVTIDFLKDPIEPIIDGEWIRANGTTLGADNGIGVAIELALLAANDLEHGPISCLFTVDEETGLTGAFNITPDFLQGKMLLNLDSEREGEFFIGCAGGIDTQGVMNPDWDSTLPNNHIAYQIAVMGLQGGHSGAHINYERGNAVKLLNRILWNAYNDFDLRVGVINAGTVKNAIAREGKAQVIIPKSKKQDFENYLKEMDHLYKKELFVSDPNVYVSFEEIPLPKKILNEYDQVDLLNALYCCPHGVLHMAQDIPNFVETSSNLASVKTENDHITISTSQRSSVKSKKKDAVAMISATLYAAGIEDVSSGNEYPGWTPNPNSVALRYISRAYKNVINKPFDVQAIHAGLECGLFAEKAPHLDMISYGPTIQNPHSPEEKLNIETVQQVWDLTVEFLRILE
ncbi:MAG: aminoacyl-histidine dipeptidase [Bacteroidetes bacterium]|nr:aminoacyl-histidine dipeptidase [Bacteroidota bacterium]